MPENHRNGVISTISRIGSLDSSCCCTTTTECLSCPVHELCSKVIVWVGGDAAQIHYLIRRGTAKSHFLCCPTPETEVTRQPLDAVPAIITLHPPPLLSFLHPFLVFAILRRQEDSRKEKRTSLNFWQNCECPFLIMTLVSCDLFHPQLPPLRREDTILGCWAIYK